MIPSTEFLKQLCLNFLTNLTQQADLKLNFHCFKVEFLLDCLRSTNDPQTQESCLQLISSTAVLFPYNILHSVMHVFAFMGGTFLKLDNEHTFNVIKKTIHTILPAILQVFLSYIILLLVALLESPYFRPKKNNEKLGNQRKLMELFICSCLMKFIIIIFFNMNF